jgi:omega-6 fatty acid desaturase (delta-12 desaturase)
MLMTTELPVPGSALPSKSIILKELGQFARPCNRRGLIAFAVEFSMYWLAIAVVLLAPGLGIKIAASVFAGLKLSALVTLGHDAAHRTLMANRRANKILGILCFLPCIHNYRLWVWDHHEVHHTETNGEHFDSYTPFSKAEFDRLPLAHQLFERVIRAPNLIGFGLHYFCQRMLNVRILPRAGVPQRHVRSAWRHFALLVVYYVFFFSFLCAAPLFAPVSLATSLLLGFVVPIASFSIITGASLYLMHTNRSVPWFKGTLDRTSHAAPELCATHIRMPYLLSALIHHVFAHSAHHAHPGVPSYHLTAAQRRLDALLGDRAVVEPLSLIGVLRTMRDCKLYDFDKHQWLDFNGKPTTGRIFDAGLTAK